MTGSRLSSVAVAPLSSAASAPGFLINGNIFTGGTGTTNMPHVLIRPEGTTAVTTWSTSGTGLGMNLASGFAGNFLDFHVSGGVSAFSVAPTTVTIGAASLGSVLSVPANKIQMAGNRVTAAWTTSGYGLTQAPATWTDTTSSGTIAAEYINAFQAPTLAFSNATTVTNAFNTYFVDPIQGSNATLTAKWALGADSARIGGTTISSTGATAIASGQTFRVGNAATTGLVAGALAALTNASIVISDSTGQAYRVPCII